MKIQEMLKKYLSHRKKNILNIKQIEKSIMKMEHYKISKLLNDSTISKFVQKKQMIYKVVTIMLTKI